MKTRTSLSRRQFLRRTAVASTAPLLAPASILGRGATPPSERLNLGCIGLGIQGTGPVEVAGTGTFPRSGLADCALTWRVENRFADGVTLVHMNDEASKQHPLQRGGHGHGILFLGSEGWVHVDRSGLDAGPKSLLEWKPDANDTRLFKSDNHHGNFVDAVKGRNQPAASIDASVRSDTLATLDQIALKLGRKLRWDPTREDFVGDATASAMLDRPMRGPWRI